jgi:hypothetical protein
VSFYEAMILLDDVVHLLAWPPFAFLKQQLLPLQGVAGTAYLFLAHTPVPSDRWPCEPRISLVRSFSPLDPGN